MENIGKKPEIQTSSTEELREKYYQRFVQNKSGERFLVKGVYEDHAELIHNERAGVSGQQVRAVSLTELEKDYLLDDSMGGMNESSKKTKTETVSLPQQAHFTKPKGTETFSGPSNLMHVNTPHSESFIKRRVAELTSEVENRSEETPTSSRN